MSVEQMVQKTSWSERVHAAVLAQMLLKKGLRAMLIHHMMSGKALPSMKLVTSVTTVTLHYH